MQMTKDDAGFAIIFLYLGAKTMDNNELVEMEKKSKINLYVDSCLHFGRKED